MGVRGGLEVWTRTDARRHRMSWLGLGLIAAGATFFGLSSPVNAGVQISVTPMFPDSVTVGDTSVLAALTIQNSSTPPQSTGTVTLNSIQLHPACSQPDLACDAGGAIADSNAFQLSPTGTGDAGTACAGRTFTLAEQANGNWTFTPSTPVVLQPFGSIGDFCRISFTFNALAVPNTDAAPASPGVQTYQAGGAGAQHQDGALGGGSGSDLTTVNPRSASIATQTNPTSGPVGTAFTDTAAVSGSSPPQPTGSVNFVLYGPNNTTCTGAPVFTSANRPLVGTSPNSSNATSASFTPTSPGTYIWVASYSGDAAYSGATGSCFDPAEKFTVTAASPTVQVDKTASPLSRPAPGGSFTFNIVVTNTSATTLTITSLTDDIYGNLATRPGSSCNTAIGTVLTANPGPGNTYTCAFSGTFTGSAGASQTDVVTVVGTDPNGATASDSDDATVTITAPPSIAVTKSGAPSSRPEPGGQFTFTVSIRNTGAAPVTITSIVDDIYGNLATYSGPNSCDDQIGTTLASSAFVNCSFTGTFTGSGPASQTDTVTATATDANGAVATGAASATVSITKVLPSIDVAKSATPTTRPEPGGAFTFNVVVTNTSTQEVVTITSLTDNIYGNLASQGTCTTAVGTVLAVSPGPGNTYACSFTGQFFGNAGASQTDIVTANAVDDDNDTATDTGAATVTLTNVAPTVSVAKSATPTSRAEPGGSFSFGVVVTNTSFEPVTVTSLTDNIYGNLNGRGTCVTGAVLAPSGTYSCSFPGSFSGNAGASQTDIVTAVVVDDDNSTGNGSDDATVTITNTLPAISVNKSAPASVPEGGSATFTVAITNNSVSTDPVTITSINDNVYGNLNGSGTCATGVVVASGATRTCTFTRAVGGIEGATHSDTVTVSASDDEGSVTTGSDSVSIAITRAECFGQLATHVTSRSLTTGSGTQVIYVRGDRSVGVNAGSGHDYICGGGGNDTLNGGSGDDTIAGGTGNDRLIGGSGHDRIHGDAGTDSAQGDSGRDVCSAERRTTCES